MNWSPFGSSGDKTAMRLPSIKNLALPSPERPRYHPYDQALSAQHHTHPLGLSAVMDQITLKSENINSRNARRDREHSSSSEDPPLVNNRAASPKQHTLQQQQKRAMMREQHVELDIIARTIFAFDCSRRQTGAAAQNRRSNAQQSGLTHEKSVVLQMAIDGMTLFSAVFDMLGFSAQQKQDLLKDILVLKKIDDPNGEEEEMPRWPGEKAPEDVREEAEVERTHRRERQIALLATGMANFFSQNGQHDLSRRFNDWQCQSPRL